MAMAMAMAMAMGKAQRTSGTRAPFHFLAIYRECGTAIRFGVIFYIVNISISGNKCMIRFAIVGCGRIAKRHADLLGQGQIAGASLVGVCDIAAEKAEKFGAEYKVPYYLDMHEMMVATTPDVVVVLTESGNHARHVIDLSRHGKHIVVEKPMALTLDDADAMIAACDGAGIRLFVVKQNRFNVPVRKLREALEEGRFGKIVMGTVRVRWCRPQSYYDQDSWRGTWSMDGGVLTNQASHHVDLLEWMMGSVESVFAMSRTALVDIEAEDTAAVALRFKNGALGVIEATTAVRPKDLEGSLSILGEGGSVEIGGFAVNRMKTWDFVDRRPDDDKVLDEYSVNPPNVYGFGHQAYLEHVVDCIRNEKKQLVDGLDGRRSLELINAIYESIETGKEVKMRFTPQYCRLGG
jgi:UDP-N-acetyl-2-amino-2-deoxyglucuronate dehydrogenase